MNKAHWTETRWKFFEGLEGIHQVRLSRADVMLFYESILFQVGYMRFERAPWECYYRATLLQTNYVHHSRSVFYYCYRETTS